MCGIVGFIHQNDADAGRSIEQMLARLAHRGPDQRGSFLADGVALGHVRLSIIDPSERGRQPFVTTDGQGVLTYNGEVYNFRELRAELQRDGVKFRSDTDTEVVLNALHHWGPRLAVSRLDGMFAFGYYDRRDRSLWLARDQFGVKPLYLARTGNALIFASEQKALFAHPRVRRSLDTQAVINLLLYERFDGSMTPFRDVESLAPGTLVQLREGRDRSQTYFDPMRDLDASRIVEGESIPLESHFERFERLLDQSVSMHLVSDAPLATMCSGGLDSSLVTAIAKRTKRDLVSYVADIEGMHGQEVRRATAVCNALGVDLKVVVVDAKNYFRMLPVAVAANDQPLFFSQDVATMLVAEALNADGFKVVLTGDGADEVFGGYEWYAETYRAWRRRRIRAKWIPDNRLTRKIGRFVPGLRPVDLRALDRDPDAVLRDDNSFPVNPINVLLVDGARRHLRKSRLLEKLRALAKYEDRGFLMKSLEDFYVHLRERLGTMDRMTMRFSVEARVPFLEKHLADFGMHLPVAAKFRNGVGKHLVRRLALRCLPPEIVDLPKIGFRVDPSMWSGMESFLRNGQVADLLKWSVGDQDDIAELLKRHPYFLFRLIGIEVWLRMCFEETTTADLSDMLLRARLTSAPAKAKRSNA